MLSAASDYFRAMFSAPMRESTQSEIVLQNVKGSTLKDLVEYCYNGIICFTDQNAQDTIEAAHEYLFNDIVQLGCEFLCAQLDNNNCIGFYLFGKRFQLDYLVVRALNSICENFEAVAMEDEFKKMHLESLTDILRMDALKIASEEVIFNAIVRWTMHDEKRMDHLSNLLKCVRFTQLDGEVSQQFGVGRRCDY